MIAIVAALGLAVEAAPKGAEVASGSLTASDAEAYLLERMQYLRTSRPTAVNLFKCTDELAALVKKAASDSSPVDSSSSEGSSSKSMTTPTYGSVINAFVDAAEAMLAKDVGDNMAIGKHGANAILKTIEGKTTDAARDASSGTDTAAAEKKKGARVMTICNTGSLATAGYGTALGVVRSLQAMERLEVCCLIDTTQHGKGKGWGGVGWGGGGGN